MSLANCRARHHSWDPGPEPGASCRVCGKLYGAARGAPAPAAPPELPGAPPAAPGPAPAAPPAPLRAGRGALGEARAAALAAALGAAPAQLDTEGRRSPEEGAGGAESPPAPSTSPRLWPAAARRLTQVFVAGCEAAIRASGREPNDPDGQDVDDFEQALAAQLGIWFPDVALTPAKQLLLSGLFIAGGMWYGSEKLPTKQAANDNASSTVPAAGGAGPAIPSPSPTI